MAVVNQLEHETWMRLAHREAGRAFDVGEVPIGAVLVCDGQVVGSGYNQPIGAGDPTAHAEVVALRAGAANIGVTLHIAPQFAMPYMVVSWLGTLLIAVSFVKQRQYIGRNFALIGEVVEQVELCRNRNRAAELIA